MPRTASDRDGNLEIYHSLADGSKTTRLTNDPQSDANPAVSPDGKQIVFMGERAMCLHIMDINGQNVRPLIKAAGNHADW